MPVFPSGYRVGEISDLEECWPMSSVCWDRDCGDVVLESCLFLVETWPDDPSAAVLRFSGNGNTDDPLSLRSLTAYTGSKGVYVARWDARAQRWVRR